MDQLSLTPAHCPSQRLQGLTALVTGAASGVGLEISRMFHAEGANVVATDVDMSRLMESLVKSETLMVEAMDVTDEENCRAVVEASIGRFGSVDILVNNAGATIRGSIAETTPEAFDKTLGLNLGSMARLARLVAPGMCAQRRGSIINMASITSTEGQANTAAYSASKGGCTALTRALAVELAPYAIRVNAISPTVIDSPMTHEHVQTMDDSKARYRLLLARQPLGRMASARDVGFAALYLASPESAFVTGINLPVDGGRSSA